ncbi:hypothetical protein [Streptomyces atratus]|uniref:hypothetical protein n=1 Tax=Streptomyces atratus TaxID=1893 RepID=UPI0021A2EA6D|nr:hypothetical protein [Streptomyces atratus]MCT2547383.1 hypothetical protein [Streptomyces atratus]
MAKNNDRTPHIPNRRQEPPATEPTEPKEPRLAALREWWDAAWDNGGVLHTRWEELRRAPALGWHGMANWIKAVLGLAGICTVIILLDGATDALADAMRRLLSAAPRVEIGADTSNTVFAVVDQPIRTYIAAHTASLPISASTIYTVWQVVGLFGLIGGFLRSSGARLTWTAWGAASIAMVYSTTPADGRTIATGLAALAWTAASALALRGLTLRPSLFIHNTAPGIELRPEIHVPAPVAPPAEGTPDNVHPLQKR